MHKQKQTSNCKKCYFNNYGHNIQLMHNSVSILHINVFIDYRISYGSRYDDINIDNYLHKIDLKTTI